MGTLVNNQGVSSDNEIVARQVENVDQAEDGEVDKALEN